MTSWAERLAQLFVAHQARLEAFVNRRTGNPQIAADLTQEAFLRLARLPDGQKVENPAGYLFTVAGNLAQDHNRRTVRWRRLDGGAADEEHPSSEPDAEAVVVAKERARLLQEAIAALPEKPRTMFLLFHVDGLSYREIAMRLEVSPRSVEYHLTHALKLCRAHVRQANERGRSGRK
jgi:RNA polymerase sigma-70 factor (ECF subfamily)